jgi:ribonuclease G
VPQLSPLRELLIVAAPGEWRAALCENGVAVELHVERGEGNETGSIHLGRVVRKLPGLAAVLVNIGGERPVFLPVGDILPRGRGVDEGERITLQIRREALGGKSARGTTRLALHGRFVELLAGRPGLSGGEALLQEDRSRLQATLANAAIGDAAGLRIKPAPAEAGGAAPADALLDEAAILARRWREIHERASRLDPPARLYPPAGFAAALAGTMRLMTDAVVVDDPAAVPEIRAAFSAAAVAHQAEELWPIDFDALFDAALSPTFPIEGGGAVHIEPARTAVLIDVDSASHMTGPPEDAGLAINLAAAGAIARQIRLRNLGGGIVVDFVGLNRPRSRDKVRRALEQAFLPDPARPQILGWTRLGHLEMVRPRHGRPLFEALLERTADGAFVKSAATIALEALRALRQAARAEPGHRWDLVVAPEVATALAGPVAAAHRALEARLVRGIAVTATAGRRRDRFDIVAR